VRAVAFARRADRSGSDLFPQLARALTEPVVMERHLLVGGADAVLQNKENIMSQVNRSSTPETGQVLRFQEAYDRMLPEIQAVEASDLVPMNIDVQMAYTAVIGALPNMRALLPSMEKKIVGFDPAIFDKLEGYARALANAHAISSMASTPVESLPALAESGAAMRENLLNDATALANRRLIDGAVLKELKGPVGYRNLGFDLLELSTLLRTNWKAIENKTAVQMSELDEAHMMADRLLSAVGERDQSSAAEAEAATIRHQAFTLLVNAYDQARRAVQFVRWDEDDLETIAPSLYAGRGSRKRTSSDVAKAKAASAGATGAATGEAAVNNGGPAGMPGGSPFVA
jgi:hypothetical protein